MSMAYINIGSNQGDRKAHIGQAVALIADIAESEIVQSDYIETPPWGYRSSEPYLNLGIAFATSLQPEQLLDMLLAIERSINPASHRDADGNYVDREIDIDLIAVDNIIIDSPRLTLPHPRMHLRDFVLAPMAQLAPDWRHPRLGLTPVQLLHNLKEDNNRSKDT